MEIYFGPQVGVLEAELNRVSEENKRLNEKIATIYEDYKNLKSQIIDLMTTMRSDGRSVSPERKRKSESLTMNFYNDVANGMTNCMGHDQIESNSSENSCKRAREDCTPKICKLYVRTDPLDSSLVSSLNLNMYIFLTFPFQLHKLLTRLPWFCVIYL